MGKMKELDLERQQKESLKMKLELKHLAPYLPYGLKFKSKDGGMYFDYPSHLDSLVFEFDIFETPKHLFKYDTDVSWLDILNHDCKPILRPLSDLTKPITVEGKEFVPIEMFANPDRVDICDLLDDMDHDDTMTLDLLPHYIVKMLFQWHFNVFDLPEHLWIDINTLDKTT